MHKYKYLISFPLSVLLSRSGIIILRHIWGNAIGLRVEKINIKSVYFSNARLPHIVCQYTTVIHPDSHIAFLI